MDSKGIARATAPVKKQRRMSVRKTILLCVTAVVLVILFGLTVNALLAAFNPDYYMSFGGYRLFPVRGGHLEPEISSGSMIAADRPTVPEAIKPQKDGVGGDIIVFDLRVGDEKQLSIGYVVAVSGSGSDTEYTVAIGHNTDATVTCAFTDIIGVYAGKKVGFFGGFFDFLNSAFGIIVLLALIAIIVLAWWLWGYINRLTVRRKLTRAALEKSVQALSGVGLRYDNIHEITAVLDVLGMLTETPRTKTESAEIAARLNAFIKAENITLPQTPETAAILDSLPAPDTPGSLAAALCAGATLRQAEDGQTLVLTTISGGKNILLTPVQTADGIILCQQGVRIKSDLAPNIEDIGFTSMPASPEFFEGQPLEKNVEYPELPQPAPTFGTAHISRSEPAEPIARLESPELQLAAPTPTGSAAYAPIDSRDVELPEPSGASILGLPRTRTISESSKQTERDDSAQQLASEQSECDTDRSAVDTENRDEIRQGNRADGSAYSRYRGAVTEDELKLAEELHSLLTDVSPLTAEEKRRIEEYKAGKDGGKTAKRGGAKRKPLTAEEKAARKAASEKKKREREEFLNSLTAEEREMYEAEQKLKKSREAAVRKLKKIAADRKLLQKIDGD